MKIKLFIVLALVMCGCESGTGTRGMNLDGSVSAGTFYKTTFEGHTYIVYNEGALDSRVGGLTHDPECGRCKNKLKGLSD